MMELECFLSAIGMAKSIIVLISSSLDKQIVDSVVHSTLLQWRSNCKILYRICLISFILIIYLVWAMKNHNFRVRFLEAVYNVEIPILTRQSLGEF